MQTLATLHRGTRRSSTLAVLATVGTALLLVGCSSKGFPNSSSSTTTLAPTTTVAAPTTGATTIPFSEAKNARQDVTNGACTDVDGAWVLSGQVKNSAATARTYQIVVDFVADSGDTVLDTKVITTPSVNPGASTPWQAKSAPGLTHVTCVIRQVQAPA
jgi:hypothetical protein